MITIGIELNYVLRDINKQIIKYYSKEFDPSIDIDEIDATSDPKPIFVGCPFSSSPISLHTCVPLFIVTVVVVLNVRDYCSLQICELFRKYATLSTFFPS